MHSNLLWATLAGRCFFYCFYISKTKRKVSNVGRGDRREKEIVSKSRFETLVLHDVAVDESSEVGRRAMLLSMNGGKVSDAVSADERLNNSNFMWQGKGVFSGTDYDKETNQRFRMC
ncbi:hypothetical protein V6N13_105874 [Hibiscus sabdariffa]|uniref:Uncharacterized protein n=1 Tax=Hibiscus sabdariffa TaxID=183260 RepID=A0ABR2EZ15_9ROSI